MIEASDPLFRNYFTDYSYDEMFSRNMDIKGDWKKLLDHLHQIGKEGLQERQNDLNWILSENGVTYNVYNDPKGLNRPWNLNITPFILHENEWKTIEQGMKQRAELLNLVLHDIYGKRELITKGIIPHEVIFAHKGFLRQCDQIKYPTTKHLHIYSSDIARGPDGRMWVVNDRTEAPSGMGYALENRSSTARILPEVVANMQVKRLSGFFQDFNQLLLDASPKKKENPNIVILTPGSHNETYFEHAYLSSFLGYPLVQGNDLVVRNGFLWMKSLKGLKRVDVVLRRVDDLFTDPLELREDSHLGVAGLLDVVRRQNVTIVNPIGSGILENPGLIPFMPAIAKYLLDEELILPQIASWWCGQEREKNHVLNNLSSLVIKRIDRTNRESIFFGEYMSSVELSKLAAEIKARPYKFVAQEKISFSTTPNFYKGEFEPRHLVCRSFSIAKDGGYSVMPGGLVRVARERGNLRVSNQRGGTSKDFWVLSEQEETPLEKQSWTRKSSISASGLDDLPSMTAENLYWAGRYVGRTLVTARFMRMVLKQMAATQYHESSHNTEKLKALYTSVTYLTGTFPGFLKKEKNGTALDHPQEEMLSLILDDQRVGSLANTISMFGNSYYAIRNLWSADMWRVFENIQKLWKQLKEETEPSINRIIKTLNQLITRLIAFMGLIEESILVEQGLLLYFIGLQLEQSILTITKCRALLTHVKSEQVEYEILESLLNSHESVNIYRYSYRSFITIENVIDLVLLDLKYPRSVAFQLNRLLKDIARLPHSKESDELTDYQKHIFEAFSKIRLTTSEQLAKVKSEDGVRADLDALLSQLTDLLYSASQAISDTYFNHTYEQNQLVRQKFSV